MARVSKTPAHRKSPDWLSHSWEQKKQLTVDRIEEAVRALKGEGSTVSYANIRERVHSLSGVWISANTIKRNNAAYQIYLANRAALRIRHLPEPLLKRFIGGLSAEERRVSSRRFPVCGVSAKTL